MLYKRGYWNAAWRPRYFALGPHGALDYFDARGGEPHGEARGAIPIAMQAGCSGADNETLVRPAGRDGGMYLLELAVQGPGPARGRTFLLASDSRAVRDRWAARLQELAEAWRSPPARVRREGAAASDPSPEGAAASGAPALGARERKLVRALEDLDATLRSGALTRAEYRARKARLLRDSPAAAAAAAPAPAGRRRAGTPESTASSAAGRRTEGLLHKRGQWNPAWKERFFVLTPRGDLEYYAAPDGAPRGPPAGVIPVALPPGARGEDESTLVRAGGRDGALGLIELTVRAPGPARGRTYVLGAPSGAEQERWEIGRAHV